MTSLQQGRGADESETDDWNDHWSTLGDAALANPANLYRSHLIYRLLDIKQSGRGASILDVGSGQGEFALSLSQRYPKARVRGLEYSQSGVDRARQRASDCKSSVTFSRRDLLSSAVLEPFERAWATHAVCSEVLEHVDDPVLLLRNTREYLAPGCRLVVTVPSGPMSTFDRHIGHRKHYQPAELQQVLQLAGFSVHTVARAGFPFYNLYRLMVVARGKRLVDDAQRGIETTLPARVVLPVFRTIFRANASRTPWGWQLTAVAELP